MYVQTELEKIRDERESKREKILTLHIRILIRWLVQLLTPARQLQHIV